MTDSANTSHDAFAAVAQEVSVTSRRHPLAMSAYAMVLAIGLIFVTGWTGRGEAHAALTQVLNPAWVYLWEAQLVSGGAIGLVALCLRPRLTPHWPDLADLLHIEAIAAFVSATGVLTYLYAVAGVFGWDRLGPTATVMSMLICGLLARAVVANRDARRVEKYGRLVDHLVKTMKPPTTEE